MLNKLNLERIIKKEISERGCTDIKHNEKDELFTGYIINKQGSKEAKIIGITSKESSLQIIHKLINTAYKTPTIELGIIQTLDKIYYIDMKTGMSTDQPKKFINYSDYICSEEGIRQKIDLILRNRRSATDKIEYILTPIAVRAYFYKNNIPKRWLELDLYDYNQLVDKIKEEYNIKEIKLVKIEDKNELEFIKMGLEMLEPTSIYYPKVIEDKLRKNLITQNLIISTPNMINLVNEFIKELNINGDCIELGSGAGCFLRELNINSNIIKGIEINVYLSEISKLLNLVCDKENIEIENYDALQKNEEKKYDLTIIEPSLGVKVDSEKYKEDYIVARNSKTTNLSDLLIEKGINITKEDGYIFAIVNDGLLFTQQSQFIRKLITMGTIVKSIISLPDHIQKPYTVAKMSIVIMQKKGKSLECSKKLYVNQINKLDEINKVSKQFSNFINNKHDAHQLTNYEVLNKSINWTSNYLKLFEELNSKDRYPLIQLCNINNKGLKDLKNKKEKYPYIEVSNIDTDKKILKNINEVEYNQLSTRAKLLAYPGDLVLSTARPDKGAIAVVPNDYEVCIVSSALVVLSPKNISTELLYFILGSKKVTEELASLASGTAVPMIMIKQLREYTLPIKEVPNQYEEEAKKLYHKMMMQYKNYKTLNTIIDEALKKIDKTSIKAYKIEEILKFKRPVMLKEGKEVKQVKIANLDPESLYINEKELEVYEEKEGRHNLIKNKDLLVPRVLDSIERTSVANLATEGCVSNHFIYNYTVEDLVLPEYVAMLFRSSELREVLEGIAIGTKSKPMLKRDGIEAIVVKLPKLEVQKEIVNEILVKAKEYTLEEISAEKSNFEKKLV